MAEALIVGRFVIVILFSAFGALFIFLSLKEDTPWLFFLSMVCFATVYVAIVG